MRPLAEGRRSLTAWAYQLGPGQYYQQACQHIASAIGLESGAFLDAVVLRGWRRYGPNQARWDALEVVVEESPFRGGEDGRHGFYRRLVLTRSSVT